MAQSIIITTSAEDLDGNKLFNSQSVDMDMLPRSLSVTKYYSQSSHPISVRSSSILTLFFNPPCSILHIICFEYLMVICVLIPHVFVFIIRLCTHYQKKRSSISTKHKKFYKFSHTISNTQIQQSISNYRVRYLPTTAYFR